MADESGSCGGGGGGGGGCEAVKKRVDQSVAFHELFGFADPLDWLLMAAGSAGAVVHGAAMPVFFLLFGELINGFGKNQHSLRRMTDEVSKARILRPMSRCLIAIVFPPVPFRALAIDA